MSKYIQKILGIHEKQLNTRIVQKVLFPLTGQTQKEIDYLIETLRYDSGIYSRQAIAMSAPQIGIMKRIMIMGNINRPKNPLKKVEILINPQIIEFAKTTNIEEEGCISIPRYVCDVERPDHVIVEYQNMKGQMQKVKFFDFEARIIQHEYDHLEGIHMLKRGINIKVNPLWEEYLEKLDKRNDLDILKTDPLYQDYDPTSFNKQNKKQQQQEKQQEGEQVEQQA